ncbi:MAG TPA: response regulator [Polyangiaceae bacterium]|nr:response regulator [Polyangiaceae bacterium]
MALSGVVVLIVEDDPDSREMLATILEAAGALVQRADSAQAGFESLLKDIPDLIVSDIAMPNEDGYSFVRRVRGLESEAAGVPAIALTAFCSDDAKHKAASAGFSLHLGKPVDAVALVAAAARLTQPRNA